MAKYNMVPVAFTRNVPDDRRSDREIVSQDGQDITYGPVRYNFIITEFDMSSQANASIYIIGDGYRVASYGNKYAIKKIKGVIPNPTVNFLDAIKFYAVAGICNNFGTSVSIDYKNYHGAGQIIGMDISITERDVGAISLTYLELWVDQGYGSEDKAAEYSDVQEYENMLKNKRDFGEPWAPKPGPEDDQFGWYISMFPDSVSSNVNDIRYFHRISGINMSFSSRYSSIDANRNIIYFGENPVQMSISVKVIDSDNQFAEVINKIMRGIQIKAFDPYLTYVENYNCTIQCITDNNTSLEFQPTVVGMSGADMSQQVNYAMFNIQAIASAGEVLGIGL